MTSPGAGAPASPDPAPDPRLRDGLRDTVVAFAAAWALLLVVSAVGLGLLTLPADQPTGVPGRPAAPPGNGWRDVLTATERQDAFWYLRIATDGYRSDDASAAFFPLYPLAIRAVSSVPGVGPLGAAMAISSASFFAALLLLHALTRRELGAEAARRTVLFAAVFPTSFFFLAPYSESLFLLLSVGAFWFARRDRWAQAAALGATAALTRSAGVLLVAGLGAEAFLQWRRGGRRAIPRLAAAAAPLLGPILYLGSWQLFAGTPMAPVDAQRNWSRVATWPWATAWEAVEAAWRYRTYWLIDLVVVAVAVAGIVIATRRVPLSATAYAAAGLLLPLTFPFPPRPLLSMPRFVVVLFPAFWGFAIAVERRRLPEAALLAGSVAGWVLLGVLFVNWHHIF